MNATLLTLILVPLLGLGPIGAAGGNPGTPSNSTDTSGGNAGSVGGTSPDPLQAEKDLLRQQHRQLNREGEVLGESSRRITDQKRALLLQLRALNQTGATTQDWNTLFNGFQQVSLAKMKLQQDLQGLRSGAVNFQTIWADYNQQVANQRAFLQQLKALAPAQGDSQAFQSQVMAILRAMEENARQEEALAASFTAHKENQQNLHANQNSHNQNAGKKK